MLRRGWTLGLGGLTRRREGHLALLAVRRKPVVGDVRSQASVIAGRTIVAAGLARLVHRALQEYRRNAKSGNDQNACCQYARLFREHATPPRVPPISSGN